FTPQVASTGTQSLAVWSDQRSGRDDDIYGGLVTSTGSVSPLSIAISTDAGVQATPTVAAIGTDYLVAWSSEGDIAAARVSGAGIVTLLGTVAATGAAESDPRLVSRGGQALLVWSSGGDVVGARFDGAGFTAPFAIATSPADEGEPAVAA